MNVGQEKIKINLARLKKAGQVFEINVDPDLAIRFKKESGSVGIREVLKAEQIFSDAKKGELAAESSLADVFGTIDALKVAEVIVREGEIQLTAEYRAQQRDVKRKRLVELIHRNAIDPGTKLSHPIVRIENAFEEAKVKVDEYKSVEEQLEQVLTQLRVVLPLKFEQSILTLRIPATYAAKSYSLVQKNSKLLKEEWNSDGSWTVNVEIPAGLKPDFLDKLNSLTHGGVVVTEEK